ncbi:hypothetical protein BD324DRAFT_629737 [Kockovaella imperatae]|uniref:DUF4110 domain-containing protein n=1 Tax=Kockovaella imperatae TaxID=4999 RepID=A0A1Y1UD43_9TREE|nr:hypothetical protein BD324DRAFT_629737 [Kockovaella imperatae]ORX35978.1 hypothetical protein BD324DRAFT_629737 [Kockovaella imperatae]
MGANKGAGAGKAAAKAAKKAKQADKAAKKEAQALKSSASKGKGKAKDTLQDEEEDLDLILQRYQEEMKAIAAPTVLTLEAPPPPRTNALFLPSPSTLAAEPSSNHLYLLFGEFFDGSRATFYNSVLRYDIAKNEWREYKNAEGPAPRSSAAGVGVPGLGEGGSIVVFGGEYASPTQTSFHHYKDLWIFNIKSHFWEKIESRKGPSGRSGHRMAVWKHLVILFGGFIDTGIKTNYLSDLWIFDTNELSWKQIEFIDKSQAPGPRSGFSLIPCSEGAVLYGGYVKEYVKGTKPKGVPLDDTWILQMDTDLSKIKWQRRKRSGYPPTLRSGCSMCHWSAKGMGVLFGGVLDEENDDDEMISTFYNDMYAYNPEGRGKWISLNLKRPKKAGGRRRKKVAKAANDKDEEEDEGGEDLSDDVDMAEATHEIVEEEEDDDDPIKTTPLTRYNAMLAVVKNTLFIYGGIFETSVPSREYTLDDFVTLNLEKLDRFVHIRGTGLEELEAEWRGSDEEDDAGSESDSDGGDSDESEDDGEEDVVMEEEDEETEEAKEKRHNALSQAEKDALRRRAQSFLGVSKDTTRDQDEILSTPLPGENLRAFYDRSRQYWAAHAYERSGTRGKALRREGFELARNKYEEYKPLLEEIERIQREAELDKSEAAASKRSGNVGERNRR